MALRTVLGSQLANLVALAVTAVGNTAANRVLTFGVRGARGLLRDHIGGLVAFLIGLALTSGSLALLHQTPWGGGRLVELVVLVGANLLATLVRFMTLRYLMVHQRATT